MSRRIYEALSEQLARNRPQAQERVAYSQWAADCYRVGVALNSVNVSFDIARFTDDCQRKPQLCNTKAR